MLNTRRTKKRGTPLWALGVPAVGVPLMVALLALAGPKHETWVDEADFGFATEQVQSQSDDHALNPIGHCSEQMRSS